MSVIVIGAGATGLAAYLLARSGAGVTVLEVAPQPGGLLATFDAGDGAQLETFYHHFFTHDVEINGLLAELGLARQVRFAPATMGIAREGYLFPFNGPLDLLRVDAIPWQARVQFGVSAALLTYVPGFARDEHTPALTWLRRWAGRHRSDLGADDARQVQRSRRADPAGLDGRAAAPAGAFPKRHRGAARLSGGQPASAGGSAGPGAGARRCRCSYFDARTALSGGKRTGRGRTDRQADAASGCRPGYRPDARAGRSRRRGRPGLCRLPAPNSVHGGTVHGARLSRIYFAGVLVECGRSRLYLWRGDRADTARPGRAVRRPAPGAPVALRRLVASVVEPADDEVLACQLPELECLLGRPLRDQLLHHWVFRGRYAAPVTDLGFSRRVPAFRAPVEGLFVATMPHVYPDERSTNNSIRIATAAIEAMGITGHGVPEGNSLAGEG